MSLKKRVFTAALLIPVFLAMIFFLQGQYFYYATVILYAWLAWEWMRLIPIQKTSHMFIGLFLYLLVYLLAFVLPVGILLIIAAIWWFFVPGLLVCYTKQWSPWYQQKFLVALMGLVTLVPFGIAANVLMHFQRGSLMLCYAIALIACADSAAYFMGRWKGREKLVPSISPNKTKVGMWGGLFFSTVLALVSGYLLGLSSSYLLLFVAVSFVSSALSMVGDLYISMIKRLRGVKDTGFLLPGHGGILDRCDAMCAGVPVLTLGLLLMSTVS
jgi:phosphatidate cytidylyltransferase